MTFARGALLGAPMALLAAGAALAFLLTANAASNVQVTLIDCESHPRRIAFQNSGDTAQDLNGWRLMSNKPNEVFDLGVVGSVAAGDVFYVFNGHQAPLTPQPPIWPWNPTEVYDESAFVLSPDGTDFIRVVDATGFPWREVSNLRCPDNTSAIPPLQQPETPTATPSAVNTGGDTNQPQGNQSDNTGGNQQTGGSQNVPAANTATRSGATTTAQTGNVSDQALGGPSSGIGALSPVGGGSPFAAHPLAPDNFGLDAAAALGVLGARMLRRR